MGLLWFVFGFGALMVVVDVGFYALWLCVIEPALNRRFP
jgi:hypothetical protein